MVAEQDARKGFEVGDIVKLNPKGQNYREFTKYFSSSKAYTIVSKSIFDSRVQTYVYGFEYIDNGRAKFALVEDNFELANPILKWQVK